MEGQAILTRVEVKGLFGYLDYELDFGHHGKLTLLYGENGSGKTTILRLIYAALSTDEREGLRTFIYSTAFLNLSIHTSVGAFVRISRSSPTSGPYHYLAATTDGHSECTFDDRERRDPRESKNLSNVLERLKQFDFDIHFLSDSRLLQSTASFFKQAYERAAIRRREADDLSNFERAVRGEDKAWLNIELTAMQVEEWFRRQIFEQGNVGQRSTNQIYLDLTKSLVSAWRSSDAPTNEEYTKLLAEFDAMKKQASNHLQLRTIAPVSFDEFKSLLTTAPDDRRADLVRILRPFMEATRAQMSALSPIANVMTLLVDELNSFLTKKKASFDAYQGWSVRSRTGPIPLRALSSGEKQLFLLLCSAFLSRQSRSVFLIDEPELSLNVYWQRTLPRTLQRIVEGVPTQYLLATHSLEILTEFRDCISNLEVMNAAS